MRDKRSCSHAKLWLRGGWTPIVTGLGTNEAVTQGGTYPMEKGVLVMYFVTLLPPVVALMLGIAGRVLLTPRVQVWLPAACTHWVNA